VIAARFDVAESFNAEGIAWVEEGDAWAYIDRSGQPVLSLDAIQPAKSGKKKLGK
jgi:hypothetical protein